MKKIYFATGNKGKAREAEYILGRDIEIKDIELDEIQSDSLKKIVTHKLNQAYSILKKPVIVDDVALKIDAWGGFPGPFVKYMHNNDTLHFLHMLRNEKNRKATLIATIGYHDGKKAHCFTGKLKVTIPNSPRGDNGWGLDPILVPEGKDLTFAQMSEDEKNAFSHRKKALIMLKRFLNSTR